MKSITSLRKKCAGDAAEAGDIEAGDVAAIGAGVAGTGVGAAAITGATAAAVTGAGIAAAGVGTAAGAVATIGERNACRCFAGTQDDLRSRDLRPPTRKG